jgi:hypothetical protein
MFLRRSQTVVAKNSRSGHFLKAGSHRFEIGSFAWIFVDFLIPE